MPIKVALHKCVVLVLVITSTLMGVAAWADEDSTFATEPPAVQLLLEKAVNYERIEDEREADWQAAGLYCEASRLGSAEAQYRLGMLYAFGKGVPKSRALGASLFSLAAAQGHFEAQKMLETIELSTTELPECLLADVLPEKAPLGADSVATANIDFQIKSLPKNKRWVVDLVGTLSNWYQVDPKLILSLIAVESDFNIQAKSPKAAMGLMQLIPATAERFNVRNAYDASQNIKGGIAYMRWLLSYFRGNVKLAVAAYNAGEGAVDKHKGVPPYAETKQYVRKVIELYRYKQHPYDDKLTEPSPLVMRKVSS
ncbi:MAG TPA: transglycosylase SLT domain-containing protein [Methylophilaceae bacterium]|nr:transglycosylase SLT domain-containing protein [Methylophilaceae bacterium]